MEQLGLFYLRYMDDIVVLVPSRWKLRKAARVVNQTLNGLGLQKRPEKTFEGTPFQVVGARRIAPVQVKTAADYCVHQSGC